MPGFRFRLADFYHLPDPPELILDPVYQDFASPFVRAERLRAETERKRAEAEHTRAEGTRIQAEAERKRAESEYHRAEMAEAKLLREQQRADYYAALLQANRIQPPEG